MNPRELNFKMPAEWSLHERTLISWPVKASMQHPEDFEAVCAAYREVVEAIAAFEPVALLVNEDQLDIVEKIFQDERISLLPIPHDDAWLRDNGPTFLTGPAGNRAAVNWGFNAWGGKYPEWALDDEVAAKITEHYGIRRFDAPLILEGGSIHTDGEGTLLTTEQCLLNPNRNPNLSRAEIEENLREFLGISKIIWLKSGLSGDETDGHIDNIACFAAPGRILMQICDDPKDENYRITRENAEILRKCTDAAGRRLEIIPMPQPPVSEYKGNRLTLSYLNFYMVNGGIILPVFDGDAERTDSLAKGILKKVFPDRVIKTINGMPIVREGGNVHCITQQMCAPETESEERICK